MSRIYSKTFPAVAQYFFTEGVECGNQVTRVNSVPYDMGRENRHAPNGTWPFFLPTFMSAARFSRGGNEWFSIWRGSSQYIEDQFGQPAEEVETDFSARRAEARDTARYQAYVKFFEKLEGIDLSETIVQAGSVAKTVNLASTIAAMTKQAAGRFGLTRVISAGWMWKNYGVEPLVSDMYSILSTQAREVKKPFVIKAGNTTRFTVSPRERAITTASGKVTYRVNCTFEVGAFDSLAQITSLDPAYIAWTALPWTFISDYFFNIGGYLRQMELAALYNTAFMHGCESAKTEVNGQVMLGHSVKTGWPCKTPYFQHHRSGIDTQQYERGIIGGISPPGPPRFNCDLGSSQLLNIAAALGSFLKR